jgi:hypothetical protein
MKISTRIVYDIATGWKLDDDFYFYTGPVELQKKGRGEQAEVTKESLANAKTNSARQGEQYGAENTDITGLESSGPGGLGSASSAYLANSLADIGRNYGNARQGVARVNAQRGFSGTPDAAFSSGINSANIAEAGANNKAYNDALMLQRENTLAAMNARSGLQGLYDPNRPLGTASESALRQSQQGSTLGDIGKGISTGVGLASKAFGTGGFI